MTDVWTVKAVATAVVEFDGQAVERVQKEWPDLNVMNLRTCRTWVTRNFNRLLKAAGKDHIVSVSYRAEMKRSPYSYYGGGKVGLNGVTVRETGDFDD